jgi:hypothetical protein
MTVHKLEDGTVIKTYTEKNGLWYSYCRKAGGGLLFLALGSKTEDLAYSDMIHALENTE